MPPLAHRAHARSTLLLLACVTIAANSQTTPPQTLSPAQNGKPGYTLRARVPLTILDIVVTDAKGHPVHGLKQSDFTILEDNQPMSSKSFEEHRSEEASPPAPAQLTLPPNSFANIVPPPANQPPNLLLLDSMNTPIGVQAIVRQQMLDYVKRMPPGTRMAIFGLTTHLFLIQGFTSDPEVLKAALTSSPKMFPAIPPMEDIGQEPPGIDTPQPLEEQGDHMAMRGQYTFDAINQIARYLSGIPGRKNLIWFSGAFPTQFPPEPRNPEIFPPSVPQMFDFTDGVKAVGDMLARAHITVFSIEPRGIDKFITSRKGEIEFGEHTTLDTIADLTGGKNFHNTNGMTEAVEEAVNTGSNFYTLTYTPTNQKLDTRFRTISVKTSQPNLHLAYRTGYYAVDPDTTVTGRRIQKTTPMQSALMRGSLEPTQILFKVKVIQSSSTDDTLPTGNKPDPKLKPPYRHYSLSYAIDVNGIDFTQSADTNYRGDFEFGVLVYNADGDVVLNSASKTVSPILPPTVYQSMQRGGANAHQEIAVPATGNYFLRIAVHDLASDRVGAIEIPTASITVDPETIPAVSPPKQ
jgi:VWFA-related protein